MDKKVFKDAVETLIKTFVGSDQYQAYIDDTQVEIETTGENIENVYINETGTVVGPEEKKGPLNNYFDKSHDDFYFGLKTEQQKLDEAYNAVAPLDLSLFIGSTAAEDNWQKINVSHEYRVLIWQYDYADKPVVNMAEISNSHIIPANNNIRRGFDTLSPGDVIFIKGYLVDWHDMGKYQEYEYKTALTPGEIADFKLGGKVSGLCRQFYVTQLQANGYIFE